MGGGGGSSQNFDAGNVFARVARAQFAKSQELGNPIYSQLAGSIKGAGVPQALTFADTSVGQAFDGQKTGLAMDMDRRGIVMRPDEAAASGRLFGLAEASAAAGTRNAARMGVKNRDNNLVIGGLSAGMAPSPATMSGVK